jgi:polyferredoxin
MNNNIYKNPSSSDLDLIEEIIEKHNLENDFIKYMSEKDQELFLGHITYRDKWITKSFYKDKFPYSQIFWNLIFFLINQKVTAEDLPILMQEKTKLPLEICNSISQDILNNQTIQKEITAIEIEEDIYVPEDISYGEVGEKEYQEDIALEVKPSENEDIPKNKGLGQDLM